MGERGKEAQEMNNDYQSIHLPEYIEQGNTK